jgi:hypothetical protein
MLYSLLTVAFSIFSVSGVSSAVVERGGHDFSQHRICPHLAVKGGGCIRCTPASPPTYSLDVRGFDVTGVTTEIDLTFPKIKSVCDCIQACLDYPGTCNNYVWKFSTADSVKSGYRTCTLCKFPNRFLLMSRLQLHPSSECNH